MTLTDQQKADVFRLWNREYPALLSYSSIAAFDAYLDGLSDKNHYIITDEGGGVVAWAFTFTRDAERWFAIIVDGSMQGRGYGSQLLHRLQQDEPALNAWASDSNDLLKADGMPYVSPLGFYTKHGFSITTTHLDTPVISALRIEWRL